MLRRSTFIMVVMLFVLGAAVLPASAGSTVDASFSLGCTGFSGSGQILLDRDNTGSSREAFQVVVTDGVGNIIYQPVVDSFFVGGRVSWTAGNVIEWTEAPEYNPLTLRVVSLAGNKLEEKTIAIATGSCGDLKTFGALPTIEDAVASESVDINAVPPRPTNPEEITQLLPGFLIVNTDNLSLRSGDGPEYTLVGIVDGGTKLIPLGRNLNFTWWFVKAGDVVGWAKAEFLVARGDLTSVTVVPSEGEITPATIYVFSRQALLSAPAAGAIPLCTIAGDTEYIAVGRTRATDWYEIQATCDNAVVKGWIAAELGAFRGNAGTVLDVTTP
ncbi:MAG: hypothetical protein LCI00_22465 [Chloroflexi bacterium]|nr:hypothetical protein [Chloroflexota bacterium]MCC6895232.1 hypothetical protein [Anaerolineae bacterium]